MVAHKHKYDVTVFIDTEDNVLVHEASGYTITETDGLLIDSIDGGTIFHPGGSYTYVEIEPVAPQAAVVRSLN